MQLDRRSLIKSAVAASAAAFAPSAFAAGAPQDAAKKTFKLNYAPHFGMFGEHGKGDIDGELAFMADQGFRAIEDNGMRGRPVEEQERIRKGLDKHGMTMGVFVTHADFGKVTFASSSKGVREAILKDVTESVEVAKRVGAKWTTVVPGRYDQRLEWDYQTANVIENLRFAAEIMEKAGVVMVLEALNPFRDHPGLFLTKIPQTFMICRAVKSPSCKILFDMYHQQITEGNIIPNIEKAWSEIAYFQTGDNPGRNEPGTGEMNYKNIFKKIHELGFQGVIGMEHGNSAGGKDGEMKVVEAYRAADSF
jgi:hydroxypyruvate isomerase